MFNEAGDARLKPTSDSSQQQINALEASLRDSEAVAADLQERWNRAAGELEASLEREQAGLKKVNI